MFTFSLFGNGFSLYKFHYHPRHISRYFPLSPKRMVPAYKGKKVLSISGVYGCRKEDWGYNKPWYNTYCIASKSCWDIRNQIKIVEHMVLDSQRVYCCLTFRDRCDMTWRSDVLVDMYLKVISIIFSGEIIHLVVKSLGKLKSSIVCHCYTNTRQ